MDQYVNLYIELYAAIYVAIINRFIDEELYIKVLKAMCYRGFKTHTIEDFDKLVIYLYQKHFEKSYNVSILFYLRDMNYRKIELIANNFLKIQTIDTCSINEVYNIKTILINKFDIVKAFYKSEKIESIFMDQILCKTADKKFVESEWLYYNRMDIFNRLYSLRDVFDVDQLQCSGVETVRVDRLEKLNILDLQIYYNRSIDAVINSIQSWMKLCDLFIDVVSALDCGHQLKQYKISIIRKKLIKK